jgi:hypothetical protein
MAARGGTIEPVDPLEVARKLFRDQPAGFPFEGFDIEELILPEGEDFGVRSDDEDVGEEELETESGFGSVIGAWAGCPVGVGGDEAAAAAPAPCCMLRPGVSVCMRQRIGCCCTPAVSWRARKQPSVRTPLLLLLHLPLL